MPLVTILAALAVVAADPPAGVRTELPADARLFIPESWSPRNGEVDVVLHLHGTPTVTEPALIATGWDAVLVTFNRKGLSAAYSEPFTDPSLFPRLIDETVKAVGEHRDGGPFRAGRIIVSSFSAGFGGVRAMLKRPETFARIDALVLADSLYCGYEGDPQAHRLSPSLMTDFRRYAREAAEGRKAMLITHSAQIPPGYGSTTETADDLLSTVAAAAEAVAIDWSDGWRQTRQAVQGRFVVLGFAGEGPEDHMRHLRRIGELWPRLASPIPKRP